MTLAGWAEILAAIGLSVGLAWPIGIHLGQIWAGEANWMDRVLGPVERLFYRAARINPNRSQTGTQYALSLLSFNAAGFVLLYALLRLQGALPYVVRSSTDLSPDLAFNVAMSYVTNTDWQPWRGDGVISPLVEMVGFTTQNFCSAASCMAIAAALSRAFASRGQAVIGNFWADLVRNALYGLLPLSIVFALALAALGVPQSLKADVHAHTLEGAMQTVATGPIASLEAIKQLGTNGGGAFKANSAHPFENPSAITNLIEMVAMNTVGFACGVAFGRVADARSEARALVIVMALMVTAAAGLIYAAETRPTPALLAAHVQATPNMEGKEVRFGAAGSAAFAAMTTGSSNGAVNAMHESFTPAGGGVVLFMILIGQTLPGGVGSGIYGMLTMALLAVFLAGLLVGRTPEYLGKKVGAHEVRLAILASLIVSASILGLSAAAACLPIALRGLSATGPHGLTEFLYANAAATANNGSAFEGLRANAVYWNTTLGIAMALGRFGGAVPMVAIAGRIAAKPKLPPTMGTFPTDGPLFVGLVTAVILIVAGLQYFPALALGPISEHFEMASRISALATPAPR